MERGRSILQATISKETQQRFKAIAAKKNMKVPELVESLIDDFVESEEAKWLDAKFAARLDRARAGKQLSPMPNVEAYYKEIQK